MKAEVLAPRRDPERQRHERPQPRDAPEDHLRAEALPVTRGRLAELLEEERVYAGGGAKEDPRRRVGGVQRPKLDQRHAAAATREDKPPGPGCARAGARQVVKFSVGSPTGAVNPSVEFSVDFCLGCSGILFCHVFNCF